MHPHVYIDPSTVLIMSRERITKGVRQLQKSE
jgi:hypothetical protein